VLAERGHKPHLVEENESLGGEFLAAAVPPRKEEIADAIQWMVRQVERSGATVELGRKATAEWLRSVNPDAVIVATGARPVRPLIEGLTDDRVVFARDVLLGKVHAGNPVLVVGAGPVGVETAEYLAVQLHQVTVIEPSPTLGEGLEAGHHYWVLQTLRRSDAVLLAGTSLRAVRSDGSAVVEDFEGEKVIGPFATVVLAMGYAPTGARYEEIGEIVPATFLIGDAVSARSAVEAIREANEVARQI
jgi:NADPH-dependent 2,4-dienoyl-CoA reductase/sulfur reductase-like enzyme